MQVVVTAEVWLQPDVIRSLGIRMTPGKLYQLKAKKQDFHTNQLTGCVLSMVGVDTHHPRQLTLRWPESTEDNSPSNGVVVGFSQPTLRTQEGGCKSLLVGLFSDVLVYQEKNRTLYGLMV